MYGFVCILFVEILHSTTLRLKLNYDWASWSIFSFLKNKQTNRKKPHSIINNMFHFGLEMVPFKALVFQVSKLSQLLLIQGGNMAQQLQVLPATLT